MTFGIDNPEGGVATTPLRKICLGKTLRRTRVKVSHLGFVLFIEHHTNFIILYPCKQYTEDNIQ